MGSGAAIELAFIGVQTIPQKVLAQVRRDLGRLLTRRDCADFVGAPTPFMAFTGDIDLKLNAFQVRWYCGAGDGNTQCVAHLPTWRAVALIDEVKGRTGNGQIFAQRLCFATNDRTGLTARVIRVAPDKFLEAWSLCSGG